MTAPEVKGIVRLSSGPKGRASAAAATKAPIKAFQKGTRERARPITIQVPKQARLPSRDFPGKREMRPQREPTRAAAVSPRIRKVKAKTAIGLG